ncbi:fatty acid desaturase [Chachezhania antarctica]|uniref:fatty acid desaturase n=1 Tax=Chachezhania antarctica TaxID=2340860 RepID=UPI000EABF337|nr:fatty acid desaturase [Chachezhania antarctica]|tara:strand:+ start:949 stop:1884 length:936 start_codon:yes stop_codon:yes gene_type:complete
MGIDLHAAPFEFRGLFSGIRVEWATLGLMVACYGVWAVALWVLWPVAPALAVLTAALATGFHSSLSHEALHGHPFRTAWINELLVSPCLSLTVPYRRFKETHLAHHSDPSLTDPYDDPESNYLDPAVWAALPRWKKAILRLNNTLLGRVVLGPWIGQVSFMRDEWRLIRQGNRAVQIAWALHIPGVIVVLALVAVSPMPFWAYGLAVCGGLGLIKIRTFLEHRAHEKNRARTAIVEDGGPLAWLFLYNNLHVVHHMHPKVPWYRLPELYRRGRARYQAANEGYVYRSYGQVILRHLFRAKDPVPHPLWRKE